MSAYSDGVVQSQEWMGASKKWAQLCTWMEGHEGSSMNHLSRVTLPQIPMIYPRQERPAMRGGQMHIVCIHIVSCTRLCSEHTQTKSHVPRGICLTSHTRKLTDKYTQISFIPPRSLAAQLSPCLYVTKTNCQQKTDKQSDPSLGAFRRRKLI